MPDRPHIIVLAGPNGAGKSTVAPRLLHDTLGMTEFVNADTIARGLSAFHPESVAIQAGRIMLRRIHELAVSRVNFAFETTLASRTFAPWLREQLAGGYALHLLFLWLPSPELAIARVAQRVQAGGHHVPDDVVRRRYNRGLRNFFELYQPLATRWRVLLAAPDEPAIIASGAGDQTTRVRRPDLWNQLLRSAGR